MFGLLKGGKCLLSSIARNNESNASIKKTIDKLSMHFDSFKNFNTLEANYIKLLKETLPIDENTIFAVDGSDLAKPKSKKAELLDDIVDGSNDHKVVKGYWISEIVAVNNNGNPISVSSSLYSTKEEGFLSSNAILYKQIDDNINNFKGKGIYVFDRGYDQNNLIDYLINKDQKFIIRVKDNRKYIVNNKIYSFNELRKKYKGKVTLKRVTNNNKEYLNKISYIKVKLLDKMFKGKEFTLLISYGINNEPFGIITNIKINNSHDVRKVIASYLKRWRIEEYFKFKKQEFEFEDIRLRSYNGIKLMNQLLTYVIGYLNTYYIDKTKEYTRKTAENISKSIKKKVTFKYYRLIWGIRKILDLSIIEEFKYISENVYNCEYYLKNKIKEINLFNYNKVRNKKIA